MNLNVLLVDDEKVFRDYIRQMTFWKNTNYVLVGEAKNSDEALAFLLQHNVDIVLLDVSMPGKNGVELSGIIANKYPSVAMVAISSFDDYDYVREILKNGAYDYILKHRLSSELLFTVLSKIQEKIENTSSWDSKKLLRQKADYWLENGGSIPISQNNSRKVAVIVEIPRIDTYAENVREAIIEGIKRILEANSDEEANIVALFRPQNRFIVLSCFYTAISEDYIHKKLEYNNLISRNNINRIYHLAFQAHICPFLPGDNAIRTYIIHWMKDHNCQNNENTMTLSLTISQQKKLLSIIEARNSEAAAMCIQDIYNHIPSDNYGLQMMITKELLDIIEKTSAENNLSLDFIPEGTRLFEYTKAKDLKEIAAIITGLYTQVLKEIMIKEENQDKYSDVVSVAMEYFRKNYSKQTSLSSAAKMIGINSSYLSRIFHKEVKVTVVDYLNQVRVEAVKDLLLSDLPLKEIAYLCGFHNYNYFLKIFKKYTGKTPKEYLVEEKRI